MRPVLMGVLIGVVASLLIAKPATAASPDVSPDLKTPGDLVVGTDTPYPPFEFGKPPHYGGFDMDLVRSISKLLDLKPSVVDTSFDTILTDVARRKFDMVASAVTITPHRKRVVRFSDPYYESIHALVVRKGSRIRSLRQLRNKAVGTRRGTSAEYFAMYQTRARPKSYRSDSAALVALRKRKVAAVLIDEAAVRKAFHRGLRGVKVSRTFPTGERYGFAFRKGAVRLRRGVNWALNELKSNGTFSDLYRKWFYRDPPRSLR